MSENSARARADALLNMMKSGGATKRKAPTTTTTTENEQETSNGMTSSMTNKESTCATPTIQTEAASTSPKESSEDKNRRSTTGIDAEDLPSKKIKLTDEMDDFETLESLPRIKIHRVEAAEGCIHEVAVPPNDDYKPLILSQLPPAKEYPFKLDPFQRQALLCLDNSQSVLVSAHTSAGKTVVALYAIAMSLRDKQRVIYTSPIKALSNQKYRELVEEFEDVGLLTGDVTINPTASCLVMTTEILRSMLYRGSEVMREVGWVIFDEIHYMRDKERGVVWEEAIILLPDNVHYVFLSATIPNARQFAEWIVFLHDQPCHVVYTDYRPVPLQHFIYPAGGDGIHLVVNEKGEFKEDGFNNAMGTLQSAGGGGTGDRRGKRGGTVGDSNVTKILRMCMENKMSPVIVFSFSRRDCEAYAQGLQKMDFNEPEEKELIEKVYNNAMEVLSETDRQLPQITYLKEFLKRGIGIHHSGLLPILKETVEILFSEGLLKTLFATETFSMGLNMPAKTVLFSSARKFDGKDYRWISSGEYVQMAGRAGRRGLDDRGIVILIVDQHMGAEVAKQVIKGQPDPLNSQFRLTYNMVLNLLRVEGINPEFMLERSFYQFQNYALLPGLYEKVKKLEAQYQSIKIPNELETVGYYKIKQEIATMGLQLQKIITKPVYVCPFLQPGRLIKVRHNENDFGWGIVISFEKKVDKEDPLKMDTVYVVHALLHLKREENKLPQKGGTRSSFLPCPKGESGVMEVVPIMLNLITEISQVRVVYPEDLRPLDNRMNVLKRIEEVKKRFPNGVPLLDPVDDMKIKEPHMKEVVKKLETYQERLANHPLRKNPNVKKICQVYEEKMQVEKELKVAKHELKQAKSLLQLDELKCRKRVLRRLGYCDQHDVITQKGRVACEISAADELLLTEMLFDGLFNTLTPALSAALLSCFTFQENAETPKLLEEFSGILNKMQEMARRIAKVQAEAKMPSFDEETYVDSFKPHMMDVVHEWAKGSSFQKILEKTTIFEGSIIRCMRRLEELMREVKCAARAMGNSELENVFAEGIRGIKRDIIFAASLYL